MYKLADVLYDTLVSLPLVLLLLLPLPLEPDHVDELDVDGDRAYYQVRRHTQRVVHHLPVLHRSLYRVLRVVHGTRTQKVYQPLIVTVTHKFVIANDETMPRHLENVDLAAYKARQLTSCICVFCVFLV